MKIPAAAGASHTTQTIRAFRSARMASFRARVALRTRRALVCLLFDFVSDFARYALTRSGCARFHAI